MIRVLTIVLPALWPFIKEVFSRDHWVGTRIRDNPNTTAISVLLAMSMAMLIYFYVEALQLRAYIDNLPDEEQRHRVLLTQMEDVRAEMVHWRDLYLKTISAEPMPNELPVPGPPSPPPTPLPNDAPKAIVPSREGSGKHNADSLSHPS